MSETIIGPWREELLDELREIFFESSSKKSFKSTEEKEQFFYKYLGYYLVKYPEFVCVAESEKLLGYCLGMPHSDEEELLDLQPHLKEFRSYFKDYPAHLHINCHSDARGQGVGSKLVKEFEKSLQRRGIKGVHLMTSPTSRNRSFYQRLGYSFEAEVVYLGSPILMMGKML